MDWRDSAHRQRVLYAFDQEALRGLERLAGNSVSPCDTKSSLVCSLRWLDLAPLLRRLPIESLRSACRRAGLSTSGRTKRVFVERLLGDWTPPPDAIRRGILGAVAFDDLRAAARAVGIELASRADKDAVVSAIAASPVPLEEILARLSIQALRRTCRALRLRDGGRKDWLVRRLIDSEGVRGSKPLIEFWDLSQPYPPAHDWSWITSFAAGIDGYHYAGGFEGLAALDSRIWEAWSRDGRFPETATSSDLRACIFFAWRASRMTGVPSEEGAAYPRALVRELQDRARRPRLGASHGGRDRGPGM